MGPISGWYTDPVLDSRYLHNNSSKETRMDLSRSSLATRPEIISRSYKWHKQLAILEMAWAESFLSNDASSL